MRERFDKEVLELIPHREPMLLVNHLISVSEKCSQARVLIDEQTPFFVPGEGVPAWIGLEYMGQTAALIAGYQQREGLSKPHLGFLMGSRKYHSSLAHFPSGENLVVSCEEAALVGESLATFNCTIRSESNSDSNIEALATAVLSVFRRPIET